MEQYIGKTLTRQDIQKKMEENDGLVHAVIRRQRSESITYEESLWAGRMGLWCAIKAYDPN